MSYEYKGYKRNLIEWCPICGNKIEVKTTGFNDYLDKLTSYVCCNHVMIDLDMEIAEYIIKLNEKGYLTRFSCSGHTINNIGYILFDIDDNLIGKDISNALNGLKNIYKDFGINGQSCIRFAPKNIKFVSTKTGNINTKRNYNLYMKELVKELAIFVDRLPDISNKYTKSDCRNGYARF